MTEPITEPIQEPKEFRYEYQPTDENGNNLGNPQVIVAASPEEAVKKMGEQNTLLIRLNRKLNKDLRLGTVFQDNIPAEAPRSNSSQYEFKPEPLTAEERMQLSQDLTDPEKFEAASARIVRSQIGDPAQILQSLSRSDQRIAAMDAKEQGSAFVRSTPDYFPCQDNSDTLINWMLKNDLDPVKENFARAYEALGPKGANILTERPAPAVTAPVPEPVVTAAAPEPTPAPQPVRKPGALGLTRGNTSTQGPAPAPQGYSPADIEKMSGEEYKRLILMPEWKKQKSQAVV